MISKTCVRKCAVVLAFALGAAAKTSLARDGEVRLLRAPDGGLQPQAIVDEQGRLHLIYLKGEPGGCDVFYAVREPGKNVFSKSKRVNSRPGSAVATGTIRGAQIAVGRNGRVHVAWNGSTKTKSESEASAPMFYARLNDVGDAFEPERNLMTSTIALDGGGSVAADRKGNVFVVWHGLAKGATAGEGNRAVFMAASTNDGKTFSPERRINPTASGACGCCGLKAFADAGGQIGVLYRAATGGLERDVTLLISRDGGASFTNLVVGPWHLMSCPMSSMSLAQGFGDTWHGAWETAGQIQVGAIVPGMLMCNAAEPEGRGGARKHPVVVAGKPTRGTRQLIAWVEGSSWGKGGSLAWELVDFSTAKKTFGRAEGVAAWSRITAVADEDGGFTIIY